MSTPLITIIAITLLGALYVTFPIVVDGFLRYRKKRVMQCPETKSLAEVDIDAPRAAVTSLLGKPQLTVKNSRCGLRKRAAAKAALSEFFLTKLARWINRFMLRMAHFKKVHRGKAKRQRGALEPRLLG